MNESLIQSFAIVAAGLVAGVVPLFFRWSHATAHRWIAFGAGALLGAAFLHLMPEGHELAGAKGLPFMLVGFVVLYLIEQISLRHPHEEARGEFHEIGVLAFIGLTVHDLVDGITLGSGEHVPSVTSAVFLSLLLHKIPMTFSFAVLLIHGGYRRSRAMLLVTAMLLAIPLGAVLAQLLIGVSDTPGMLGGLILFSAGTFVYISAYELLPEMHRNSASDRLIGVFFAAGVGTMLVLRLLHPQS